MLGNTASDAIKYLRDRGILADTEAGERIYLSQAPPSAEMPYVVMEIISNLEAPTQDDGSAVDTFRIQVDVYAKNTSIASGFETAAGIEYALRVNWSRTASQEGDYDNGIQSVQESGYRTAFYTDLDAQLVSRDYMVRVVGQGSDEPTEGPFFVNANVMFRKKFTLDYLDFATDDTTNTLDLWDLPAKGLLHMIVAQPSALFSGGGITEYTIKMGIDGALDKYLFDQSVYTGATLPLPALVSSGIESMTVDTTIKVTATSTDDNLDQASAGSITFWIYYSILQ